MFHCFLYCKPDFSPVLKHSKCYSTPMYWNRSSLKKYIDFRSLIFLILSVCWSLEEWEIYNVVLLVIQYQKSLLWNPREIFLLMNLLQEGGSLPGPETGLLSNTQKWIVRGDTCWQSKRFYWERAPGWRAVGSGNPGELLCHVAHSLGFYGDGISFWVVFSQSFWLRVLPGGACLVQSRWMPERRILGGGQTCCCLLLTFPELFRLVEAY